MYTEQNRDYPTIHWWYVSCKYVLSEVKIGIPFLANLGNYCRNNHATSRVFISVLDDLVEV